MKHFKLAAVAALAAAVFASSAMAKDADPALVKARQKIFGIENVDDRGNIKEDKVIVSWATMTEMLSRKGGR